MAAVLTILAISPPLRADYAADKEADIEERYHAAQMILKTSSPETAIAELTEYCNEYQTMVSTSECLHTTYSNAAKAYREKGFLDGWDAAKDDNRR
jgi:hypothetical protein